MPDPYQQPPAGQPAPPPPAGQPAPPPPAPYAPQPVDQPYTGVASPQAPAPPKKSKGWIVAVVVVILGCLLLTCAGVGLALFASGGDEIEAVNAAEEHYTQAVSVAESSTAALEALPDKAGKKEIEAALDDIKQSLGSARDELAAARALIEPLDESEGRTAYLASLEQASKLVDAVEELFERAASLAAIADRIETAGGAVSKGMEHMNDAIDLANADKFAAAKAKAKTASAEFARASRIFRELHGAEPEAGFDKAADYCELRREQADLAVRMAQAGIEKKTSTYNALIDKSDALEKRISALDEPAIVSDPDWFAAQTEELRTSIDAAAQKADELRQQALKAFGESD